MLIIQVPHFDREAEKKMVPSTRTCLEPNSNQIALHPVPWHPVPFSAQLCSHFTGLMGGTGLKPPSQHDHELMPILELLDQASE